MCLDQYVTKIQFGSRGFSSILAVIPLLNVQKGRKGDATGHDDGLQREFRLRLCLPSHRCIFPYTQKMRSHKRWFDFQAFRKRSLGWVWIYFGSAAKFWREYRKDAKHLALEHKLNVPLGCSVLNHSLRNCGQKSLLSGGFNYFHVHPYLRKWSNKTSMFFRWVGSTTTSISINVLDFSASLSTLKAAGGQCTRLGGHGFAIDLLLWQGNSERLGGRGVQSTLPPLGGSSHLVSSNPRFWAMKTPFRRGLTRCLGDLRSPWLLTTYELGLILQAFTSFTWCFCFI